MKVLREGVGVIGSELGGDLVLEARTVNASLRETDSGDLRRASRVPSPVRTRRSDVTHRKYKC